MPADTADPSGTTPLHLAARGGDASLAELLTGPTGRADPGLRDGEGNQALHIAAACGHLEVVKVIVEKAGADLGQYTVPKSGGRGGGTFVRVFNGQNSHINHTLNFNRRFWNLFILTSA